MNVIDRNRNGRVDEDEHNAYLQQKVDQLRRGFRLIINGKSIEPQLVAQELSFPPGQGGLSLLRIVTDFEAALPSAKGTQQLDYRDDNYSDRLGWKEIVIQGGAGVTLSQSNASLNDRSAELTAYPEDMLSSPLDQREARATFEFVSDATSSAAVVGKLSSVRQNVVNSSKESFAGLVTTGELSPTVFLISLLVAIVLGGVHALEPGHGKTVVGAYLVGSRGTARHAVFLGLIVTLTHTAGVYVLGLVTLFASQFILPETLYPWLSLISGLIVVVMGATMLASRVRDFRKSNWPAQSPDHHPHDHGHNHDHDHDHSHLPPGADGVPITGRSLLAAGISGGLLPCPSALVVLLSAISLHRVGFGLFLVAAYSIGLAAVLVAIGLVLVYAGHLFSRIPTQGRFIQLLPIGSALIVATLGVVIAAQAARALILGGVLKL
ncbi:MAG: high-affinity nickel-transporter [Chloroflexi bacterium]|nr:high-affinity nickel-transporter [Chloroflexota bacterium]